MLIKVLDHMFECVFQKKKGTVSPMMKLFESGATKEKARLLKGDLQAP